MKWLKKFSGFILRFFKTHKWKWLSFVLLFFVFFLIRFPYEATAEYLINQIRKTTKIPVRIKYENFYIHPMGPAVVFQKPEILTTKNQPPFTAEKIILRPSYKSLLRLQPGGTAVLKWPDSSLTVTIGRKRVATDPASKREPSLGWSVQASSSGGFNPYVLHSFWPMLTKIEGKINFNIQLLVDPTFNTQPEGQWSINGANFQSRALSYTFPGAVGTISLPAFAWSRVNFQGKTKEGETVITDLSLGGGKDAFQLKTRGIVRANLTMRRFSKRIAPRFKNYNIGVDILADQELKSKLYFLDLFFQSAESQTAQGSRYLLNIKGNTANPFDSTAVTSLPTLQEIQNPPEEELF